MTKAAERWDKIGDNPLVIISELIVMTEAKEKWIEDVVDFVGDEDLVTVLNAAARFIAGEMPERDKVIPLLIKLEAHALKFRTQYSAFMSYKKGTTEANMKKNHYKEIYTGLDRLVDTLKYMART